MNLTTGYSQGANDLYQQHHLQEAIAVLGVFTEDVTRLSGIYCLHSGRYSVTREDTKLALKTRAYYGDMFWNRSDIQQRLAEMREFLNQPDSEDDSEDDSENDYESDYEYNENVDEGQMSDLPDEIEVEMNEEKGEEEHEPFIKSECMCEVCSTLNGIEEKWNSWNPTEPMEISVKNLTFMDDSATKQEEF